MTALSGEARLAGIMGWPVRHSRSPRLHGFWLEKYGVDGGYVPLPVHPDHLETALRALPVLGFAGCNLTIPHKEKALRIVDRVDPIARRIGAINTILVDADGTLEGRNTDGHGFLANILADGRWQPKTGPAVVLGAGGAARAVLVALIDAGVPEIRLTNRTRDRAEALAQEFGPPIHVVDWAEREEALDGAALLVNTTSLGMIDKDRLDLRLDALPTHAVVNDIVYAPLETTLLADARARGLATVDGLGMLLHQAAPGFAAWFGVTPSVDAALRRHVLGEAG